MTTLSLSWAGPPSVLYSANTLTVSLETANPSFSSSDLALVAGTTTSSISTISIAGSIVQAKLNVSPYTQGTAYISTRNVRAYTKSYYIGLPIPLPPFAPINCCTFPS